MTFRILPEKPSFNFFAKRNAAFILSLLLMIASIVLLFTKGLNFGIDFTGGVVMEIQMTEAKDIAEVRAVFADETELGEVSLQHITQPFDNKDNQNKNLLIRLQGKQEDQGKTIEIVKNLLDTTFGTNITYRRTEYVGPQVGKELIQAGVISLVLSCLAISAYIWARFEWQFSVGAMVSLVHDLVLTLGFFSLLGLEFNLTSIAAILTILGYSINDTVIVYDRVRENLRKFKKMPINDLLNSSVNDTLSRTIMTSSTTLYALLALIVLGGDVIYSFSLAMFFGVFVGTYSSIYIAAPFLILMKLQNTRPQAVAEL